MRIIWLICLLFPLIASGACRGRFINPITDVCWTCLFPISLGSAAMNDDTQPDTPNPKNPLCVCPSKPPLPDRVGLAIGYWEPIRLVDVTRTPFCFVQLGGLQLKMGKFTGHGFVEKTPIENARSFYHVHWMVFPLLYWLNLVTDGVCVEKTGFDVLYVSELDPTWRNDTLAFILNPEAVVFANVVAQTACVADSIAANIDLPLDVLFWCAGSQGGMYPLTGHVGFHISGIQASTLLAERMTYKLHREGLLWDSDIENLCSTQPQLILPKSRYRYQMTYPVPAAKEPTGCKPFGHTTALWGRMREYPIKGEDFGYLIWRKRNCCAF